MLAAHIPNPLPTSVLTKNLSWTHPAGRLIWAVVLLVIGVGIILIMSRRPKSPEPPTWAMAMGGGLAVFSLMILAYGTIPHEWIVYSNSYLKWGTAKYIMQKNRFIRFDLNKQVANDGIAALIYVVLLVGNIWLFSKWQKRPVRAPEPVEGDDAAETRQPAGTSAYNRPVTAKV